jgi:hypothetical protein
LYILDFLILTESGTLVSQYNWVEIGVATHPHRNFGRSGFLSYHCKILHEPRLEAGELLEYLNNISEQNHRFGLISSSFPQYFHAVK